jgi:hypothetical protein
VTDELDAGTVLAQGAAGYGAPVELAAEHATYDI